VIRWLELQLQPPQWIPGVGAGNIRSHLSVRFFAFTPLQNPDSFILYLDLWNLGSLVEMPGWRNFQPVSNPNKGNDE